MGIPLDSGTRPAGAGDMFLKIKGAKAGEIKGEASDKDHKGEIEVLSWSWGLEQKPSLGSGGARGRATIRELKITKNVDKASTPLMTALRTNEPIKEAKLTVRKAGKTALEYFKITIENGRVMSLDVEVSDIGGSAIVERVSFSFNKIAVDYTPQGQDGQPQGSMSFVDSWEDAS